MENTKENSINPNRDFFKEAEEFLRTQIPENYQDNLTNYLKEKNYTKNEFYLFRHMLSQAFDFEATIITLKNYS